jgi:hypothetical protein
VPVYVTYVWYERRSASDWSDKTREEVCAYYCNDKGSVEWIAACPQLMQLFATYVSPSSRLLIKI